MTVLRARADLYRKQVFYCTDIALYLYCYLDGVRCSWIVKGNKQAPREDREY